MYLSKISGFVTFLSNKNHPLTEILAHLVRVVFRDLNSNSIILFELDDRNQFILVDTSGISEVGQSEMVSTYSLSEKYPIADSIRFGKIIFIDSDQELQNSYPLLANFPSLMAGNSLICVPISLSATPIGAFAIFCENATKITRDDLSFLEVISDIFSLSVYGPRDFHSGDRKIEINTPHLENLDGGGLSPRQLLISRLIAEGRTNHDISELIGYSESTVRQEIMKIFVLTNSTSRRQVGEHYQITHFVS